MGLHTKIEWVVAVARAMGPDARAATWNPISGCSRASEGCRNCYAAMLERRFHPDLVDLDGAGTPRFNGTVRLEESRLEWPLKRRARMAVFVGDMADIFHGAVEYKWLDRIFMAMALRPDCIFMLLTKRPEVMHCYVRDLPNRLKRQWPLPNVWFGTTVEDQQAADTRIPILLETPAAVRFLSCEPLLGPVDLTFVAKQGMAGSTGNASRFNSLVSRQILDPGNGRMWSPSPAIDWVITGGESGPRARPAHPDWFRSLRDQCAVAGVPFLFKQWGEWAPGECCPPPTRIERTADLINDEWSFGRLSPSAMEEMHRDDQPDVYRVGKARASRLLDGDLHDAVPEVSRHD